MASKPLEKQLKLAYKKIKQANAPLFFFDDDADGLCSALLLCKHFNKQQLYPIKSSDKQLLSLFSQKKQNENADLIVITDKAAIPAQALESLGDVIWIDHHTPPEDIPQNVLYINPQTIDEKDNRPATYWVAQMLDSPKELLWLIEAGIAADWQLSEHHELFCETYPDYATKDMLAQDILFTSKLGDVIRSLDFNLHGKNKDVDKAIQCLLTINDIEQLVAPTTVEAQYVYDRYTQMKSEYDALYANVIENAQHDEQSLVYTYSQKITSFTSYLSNQILYENPNKLIVIARIKDGSYRCSLRITPPYELSAALAKVFSMYPGEGGGHPQACGARIPEAVFTDVVAALKRELFE